jgi:hypothetical protein
MLVTDEHRVAQPGERYAPHPGRVAAVLEHLALDEADLVSYATELKADRDAYRLLAQVSLGHLATLTRTVTRQRETIVRLHGLVRDYVGAAEDRHAA